jgi:alpha-L-fucosidase 2
MFRVNVFVLSVFVAIFCVAGVSVSGAEGLRHGITNDRPSDTWRSAPPLGNGVLGATPYGDPLDEIILLNHEALFYPLWFTPTADDIPNMAPHLPKVRELILQGHYSGADGYWNRKLSENNYGHERIPFTNPFHPLGDIAIKRFVDGEIKDYKQVLDFETGEAVASWTQKGAEYNRSAFVSRADDVVVVRLGSSLKKHGVTANICLARHMTDARVLPMEYRNHQIMPDTDILPMFMSDHGFCV